MKDKHVEPLIVIDSPDSVDPLITMNPQQEKEDFKEVPKGALVGLLILVGTIMLLKLND